MAALLAVALLLLCGNVQSDQEGLVAYVTQVNTEKFTTSSTTPAMAPAITSPTEGSGATHTAVLSALQQDENSDPVLVDLARSDDENLLNATSTPAPSPSGEAPPEGFDMQEVEAPNLAPPSEEEAVELVAPGPDSGEPAAPGPDSAYSDSDEGKLVSDVGESSLPTITEDQDFSNGDGYGVNPTSLDADPRSFSFSAYGADSVDPSGDGKLVSDVGESSFPTITEGQDFSNGDGYGVNPTSLDADPQSFSFSAYGADSVDPSGDGKLVSDVGESSFPTITEGQDFSNGDGYGVNPTSLDADPQSFSFSAYGADSVDPSGDGKLVSDVGESSFPTITEGQDFSNGDGYGVNPTSLDADPQSFSFSAYGADSVDPSGDGKLVSDVGESSLPTITEDQDFSNRDGYGVVNQVGEGDNDSATTQDEAESESGTFESTEVTLRQSHTYSPPPESKGTWGKGKCTFYGGMDAGGTMSGACGYGNLYASGYGTHTTALSSALFKNGMACGACYEVACNGNAKFCKPGSVLVTVTNFCPPNPGQSADNGGWCNGANQHFDLSYPAFTKIADPKAGVVPLKYRRVPCKKQGGIRFTLNGNCNFNLVTITNVGGSGVVAEAYMKGDGMDWASMTRNWGANWQCSRNYCGKGISIKIVTSDKKVSVSRLAGKEWAFGKTYTGQQVY